MGRSVAVPTSAICTVFLHDPAGQLEALDDDYPDLWEDFIAYLIVSIEDRFPSMQEDDRGVGRELRVVASNAHADVVVGEYCGCVSVSLVPDRRLEDKGDYASYNLACGWSNRVAESFRKCVEGAFPSSAMRLLGTMSNGVSAYQRVSL